METSTQYDHSRQPPMRSLAARNQSRSLSPSQNRPLPAAPPTPAYKQSVIPTFPAAVTVGRGSFGNIQRPAANNSVGQRRIPNLHTTARCGVSGPIRRTHRGTGSAKSSSPSQLRRQQPLRWGEFTCTEILVTDDDGEPKVDRCEQESTEAE